MNGRARARIRNPHAAPPASAPSHRSFAYISSPHTEDRQTVTHHFALGGPISTVLTQSNRLSRTAFRLSSRVRKASISNFETALDYVPETFTAVDVFTRHCRGPTPGET